MMFFIRRTSTGASLVIDLGAGIYTSMHASLHASLCLGIDASLCASLSDCLGGREGADI